MKNSISVTTAAGDVVADLSWVVETFDGYDAMWKGPVGFWQDSRLVGVVLFSEIESSVRGAEWPDLADADLEKLETSVLAEISEWDETRKRRELAWCDTVDAYKAHHAKKAA